MRPLFAAAGIGLAAAILFVQLQETPPPAPAAGAEVAASPATAPPGAPRPAVSPGCRVEQRVAPVGSGLRCPDGTFLPLLNGVPQAPPITRAPELGPLPPVVAIIVDQRGDRWYEHADGSATTTRFREVIADGVSLIDVETVHNARVPDSFARPRQ
jgi:hypothetical protein